MKPACIFFLYFLFISLDALLAQTTTLPDSLEAQLSNAQEILSSQPEQALVLASAALKHARQEANIFGQAKAHKVLARIYAEKGDYLEALASANQALTFFQQQKEPKEICSMYITLGVINRYLKLYKESIQSYLLAEHIAKEHAYLSQQAAIYGNMGNVYFDTHNFEEALKYHLKSLEIDTRQKNEAGMGNTYHNIGMIYRSRKEYSKALSYYEKSLAIDLKNNNQRNMSLSYLEFSSMYAERGEFAKALTYAEKALKLAQTVDSRRLKKNALGNLPLLYAALGQTEKALAVQKAYTQLDDSLQSADLMAKISDMQARYQTEQKEKEISLQNLRLAAQQTSLKLKDMFILGLSIVLLMGGLIAFLLFNRYKLQQLNLKLSLENQQYHLSQNLQIRQSINEIIHYFATSLYGKNTVDEILWDIAKNCISRLGLVDCVIYLVDEQQHALVQKAAYGTKNPDEYAILSPIVIPLGQGIVGSVALSGKAEMIQDTSQDARYIVDDQQRSAELAVPIFFEDKVIGVIDSEHPEKGFFKPHHLEALQTIAAICSSKIAKAQAEEQAKEAQKMQLEAEHIKKLDAMKSQFFANISHEFRTPLHLIMAPLQKKEEEISFQEMVMMERNAHRLLRLVNQLLDLAKAEVGMLEMNLKKGNIIQFLSSTANLFVALAESKQITYHITLEDQQLIVAFDPDKLEKIVYNLLSNAIKFTPPGGEVSVHATIEPGHLLKITVSDTGLGIPEHLQSKIFDRFYQIDSSQTRAFEGTGIGLALTKELVELCKGSIHLDSSYTNGSSFIVKLPLVYEQVLVDSLPQAETPTSLGLNETILQVAHTGHLPMEETSAASEAKPTILLVEDHAELRHYLQQQLAKSYQVVLANQGDEALTLARKIIPDLIITDIMMPVMDGVTLTRHLKEEELTSHIPVVMLTAKDDVASKTEGFLGGAEQYLVKPFVIGELMAGISSLLTQRSLLQKKYSQGLLPQPAAVPDRQAAFIERIIHIVEAHIGDEKFSVEVLQKEIGMSRMQLHRKLKALTNQSTNDFIRSIRLKKAAHLLRQPGIQIAEAAYQSGFNHLSYFSKCFKEQFGVLPSEYAKQPA